MTAIRKKIGHIILKGGTVSDIQKELSSFPSNPTLEFFEMLGYAKSTAQKYLCELKKNNLAEKNKLTEEGFIFSKNADLNNLLVDTSAIGNDSCINIIFKASHVTILYQTVVEMDNVRRKNKGTPLSDKILDFSRKVLKDPDEFEIAPFSTNSSQYVDDAIIDYIKNLNVSIRPTLITADANLCLKATCYGLEYIYYSKNCPKKSSSDKPKDQTKIISIGHGFSFIKTKKKYFIEANGDYSYELIRGKKKYRFILGVNTKTPVESGDSIKVYADDKEYIYQVKHLIKKFK